MSTERHRNEVRDAIERALASGHETFEEVLRAIGSPDPRMVEELFAEAKTGAKKSGRLIQSDDLLAKGYRARRLSAHLPLDLPAPDPMWSQWWCTLDSTVTLAQRTWDTSSTARTTQATLSHRELSQYAPMMKDREGSCSL